MRKTTEYYFDLLNKYCVEYENDDYKLIVDYNVDENKNPVLNADPTDNSLVRFSVVQKKDKDLPGITFHVKKEEETYSYIVVSIPFERHVYFRDMHNEQGAWAKAGQTVLELNDVIKELFPGYNLTEKTDY